MLAFRLERKHMTVSLYVWVSVALTLATVIAQAAILIVLAKRKMRSDFPVFFGYSAYGIFLGVVLASAYVISFLRNSYVQYFYMYTVLNALLMIFEFGLMYELVANALKPYSGIIDLGKMLFRWAGLFLLLAAGLTALATMGSTAVKCNAGLDLLERSLRLMQCGLLLLFFLFERRLALSWRSHPISLALGLGISAATGLSFGYLRSLPIAWISLLNVAEIVIYFGVNVFWVACFAKREPQKKNVLDSPSRLIFQRWNEVLTSHGYGGDASTATVESFLPGIEKTVDRVMARKIIL